MSSVSPASAGIYRSPGEVLGSGWRHRHLIFRLARREIEARYRGSLLGIAWTVLIPLLLLAVYTFVFSIVFQARWNPPPAPPAAVAATTQPAEAAEEAAPPQDLRTRMSSSRGGFALILFSGLVVFNLFAECVNRAPSLVRSVPTYVTKVVFPLEGLAWVALLVSGFNALVSGLVLMAGYVVLYGLPPLTLLGLPLVLLPMILLTLGLTWFLASLGVYLRDLEQFVPVLTTILMFMSPIFYPLERIPAAILPVFRLNPLAATVEATRGVLFWGHWPDWGWLLVQTVLAFLIAWLGYMWFAKTRKGFADVL